MTLRGRMTDRPAPALPHKHAVTETGAEHPCAWCADRTEPALTAESHQPGDAHRYRITCEICGIRGTIRLSIDPESAQLPQAAAAQRAVAAGDERAHNLKVQHNGELLAQQLIHERRLAAGEERVRLLEEALTNMLLYADYAVARMTLDLDPNSKTLSAAVHLLAEARAALAAAAPAGKPCIGDGCGCESAPSAVCPRCGWES